MKDRTAPDAKPSLRDSRYQAERIVATAAAAIKRRQNTLFLDSRHTSRVMLERIDRQHHLVLSCAVELDRAYLALEAASRRVTARIASLEPELILQARSEALGREPEPPVEILVHRVTDRKPEPRLDIAPAINRQPTQALSDERHAA